MPDGLLARLGGTAYDDLEALVVVEEAAVEFVQLAEGWRSRASRPSSRRPHGA
jgi:hypothetical protein